MTPLTAFELAYYQQVDWIKAMEKARKASQGKREALAVKKEEKRS